MWEQEFTEELEELYEQYIDRFGPAPDEYIELCYNAMTYDEFVGYIKECLKTGEEMPEVVE